MVRGKQTRRGLQKAWREVLRGRRAAMQLFPEGEADGGGLSDRQQELLEQIGDAVDELLGKQRKRGRKAKATVRAGKRQLRPDRAHNRARQNSKELRQKEVPPMIEKIIRKKGRAMGAGEIIKGLDALKFDWRKYSMTKRPQGLAKVMSFSGSPIKRNKLGLWDVSRERTD